MINHIDEGIWVLIQIGASDETIHTCFIFIYIYYTPEGAVNFVTLAPRKRTQSQLQHYLNDSIANIHLDDRYVNVSSFA
jgi:hypothetical protein